MITLKHSRRRTSYSDNGNESLDRNPNRDHPARSHGTFGLTATGVMAATGVAGLGLSAYGALKGGGSASMPPPRDLNGELNGIAGAIPGFNQAGLNNQLQNSGAVTANNQNNYNNLLRGRFDTTAYNAANPGVLDEFKKQQAEGGLQNWSFADFAAANAGKESNDPSLNQYYTNGLGSQMRSGWESANPQLTAYNQTFGDQVNRINAQGPASYNAQGYQASGSGNQGAVGTSLASFNPYGASASTAGQQYANGGPLMGALNQSAGYNLDRVSGLQAQQQGIASNLLGAGGGLTQGELMGAQDSARAAYADRGMVRSNSGIGAEILQTDAAQRNRLMSNLGIAQGVDAAGQAQLGANRGFALGVQGQGQNLSQFNAGQGNTLGQFNAGLLTNNSQFNAGQFNNVGLNLANNNADRQNQMGQFNASLLQNNNQFNAGQVNNAAQFNSSAANQAGATNAGLAQSFQNDAYNRSAGYGNFLLGQAQNPNAMAMNLMGNAPDYTSAMLGYGQDLYNTNYNGGVSAANSARNNSAAMTGAGLNLLGSGMNAYANYAGMQGYGGRPGGGNPGGLYGGGSSYG